MKIPMTFVAYVDVKTTHDRDVSTVDDWMEFLSEMDDEQYEAFRMEVMDSVGLIDSCCEVLGALSVLRDNGLIDTIEYSRALPLQSMEDYG